MAEEREDSSSSGTGPQAGSAGANAAAIAMGLTGAHPDDAGRFLREQTELATEQRRLVGLQMEEMRAEEPYKLSHYRLRRFSDYAKAAFEFSAGLLALALVGGAAAMVWNAAHADGLVIESFSAAPDLAAKGNSGEVMASRLLDKISAVQTASPRTTTVGRALSSSGDAIKVEIPETGVSLGEAWRFLRGWLGHETHVTGEVVRTDTGIAVAVRIDGRNGASFAGKESDLDGLMLKAAEHVVEVSEPNRYATYLVALTPPRVAEASDLNERLAADSSRPDSDRAAALNGLYTIHTSFMADLRGAAALIRRAAALDPGSPAVAGNFALSEFSLGHDEAGLTQVPAALAAYAGNAAHILPNVLVDNPGRLRAHQMQLLGDTLEMERQGRLVAMRGRPLRQDEGRRIVALALASRHDGGAVRDWFEQMPPATLPADIVVRPLLQVQVQAALQQWADVISTAPAAERAYRNGAAPERRDVATILAVQIRPLLALARAKTGDIAGAEHDIAATPGDCYDCVRIRGAIASEAKAWGRADYWFAQAVRDGPSIPLAHEDWGRSLLARGKPDDAIAQFKLSNHKGPHFADALEGWGEALMAKNQSHLALAKFAEAEKYGPNWGRLHLKWGQALVWAGKPDEAKAHLARATQLDMTPSEKAELARVNHG
ncbi:MAG: hypothetical protein JO256_04970 [Alphaproteobacteria bacterium]|nr:hypothetical protein [Alphaproteobacteria bacterium]